MRKYFLFALIQFIVFGQLSAQKCGMEKVRAHRLQEHPELKQKQEEIELFTKNWSKDYFSAQQKTSGTVTVPVVVHVLYRNNTQNINMAQIQSQIHVLNEDFSKTNSNFSSTPQAFQSLAADVEIAFCLASVDPNGKPTSGVTRTLVTKTNIGNTEDWYKTASGGKDGWDRDKYVNIWVCEIDGGNVLGFATPPGMSNGPNDDGIVIDYNFFGTIGTAANSAPNNLGRTATHEMGHYFNLEHVWGVNGGCSDDDYVHDTPNQEQENYGCPSFPSFDNCTSSGNGTMFCNYLDYTDDNCMTMFTHGQKVRMLAALNGPRSGLLTSNGCNSAVSVNNQVKAAAQIDVYPNPSNGMITIELSGKEKYDMGIFNMTGRKVHLGKIAEGRNVLDLKYLPNGMYFIRLGEKNNIITKKIVLAK